MPLFSRKPTPTSVPDPHLADDLTLLASAVETGDPSAWSQRLGALAADGRWHHRHLLVEHTATHPDFADAWLHASFEAAAAGAPAAAPAEDQPADAPQDEDDSVEIDPTTLPHGCLTTAGVVRVRQAWEARSGRQAEHVSREAFQQFHEMLDAATPLIQGALHADREDPTAWASVLDQARGLQADAPTFHAIMDAAQQACPTGYAWHASAVEYLSPWWFGTSEASWDLAVTLSRSAPGTRSEMLPAAAAARAYWKERTPATEAMLSEALPQAHAYVTSVRQDEVELVSAANELAVRLYVCGLVDDAARAQAPAGRALDTAVWRRWFDAPETAHAEVLARAEKLKLL
ncbi:hypothetical protein [Nocardioides bruguierae]|uniref:hypothetical protein n=1 Tax=Nocardioides bruguierae TaxID=2945102 RepID=UPI002021A379|nr:hypothetical protein [Nocardioides bruguierae]MCL8027572.1 hypothetical protein [Nocardioides bruguierae]